MKKCDSKLEKNYPTTKESVLTEYSIWLTYWVSCY